MKNKVDTKEEKLMKEKKMLEETRMMKAKMQNVNRKRELKELLTRELVSKGASDQIASRFVMSLDT